ncbi:MAG: type II toxin-antitoxin system Phd/YefM family antitoxin [Planctomycetota bacterium]
MKTTTVTEAKAHLSRLLRAVQQGETVLILSRGRPVARLEPVGSRTPGPTAMRLAHLVRSGLVQRPRRTLGPALRRALAESPGEGASLLDALLAEREEGR